MSNTNYNGGRGGRTQTKATSASEHKVSGSHKGNPGGTRADAPFAGSHVGNKGAAAERAIHGPAVPPKGTGY